MNKTIVPIQGMHCKACEILIQDELKQLPGVKKVHMSYKNSEAEILSTSEVPMARIRKAIEKAGYKVGRDDPKAWITKNPEDYRDILLLLPLLVVLLITAKALGLQNLSAGSGSTSSLAVVLLVGLTAGFSTCMALVGGLILGVSARHAASHPEASSKEKFIPHVFFNLGRIASYAVLGGLIGLLGKAFQMSGMLLGVMTVGVGLVMLLMGIQLTGLMPRLSHIKIAFTLGGQRIFEKKDETYSHTNAMVLGALTFFLPCGFTQSMQIYAMSTGNFLSGALIMATFAIGTTPGLLGVGGLSSLVKGAFARRFFKFAGLVVIAFAAFNLSNGANLLNLKGIFSFDTSTVQANVDDPNVVIKDGVQVVSMTQIASGYKPNKFTIQKGIPVKWVIDSKDPYSCASSLVASKIGVRKSLTKGENIIEFTPKETGEIKFSCSMGMYNGKFIVVEAKI
ncbi:hypothetical protein AUK40_00425 [Candidatus Wirthbacteria bacterium CG2_30_54_11]|uniref:HMA domain-containing protein n=1 Tax=Candidatus Wirthbacteria bacterium CG2_30_54_11 TaxID=1817892 RepID=A0A1J5IRG6_9BACT|nr:MAG: hypothetical protein AUK40_00425 [Candidatus Wirthbacteria bacterium CG2_30_54_11]